MQPRRLSRYRFLPLLPLMLAVLTATGPARAQQPDTAEAATPDTTARPNILFAIADDASFPHFGAYGATWVRTPAFDRVAAEGLLFLRAYTPNAKCAPSRSAILTGRNSWQLEEAANHVPFFPERFTVYPEVLGENGYVAGYTGKGWAPGIAERDGRPRLMTGQAFNEETTEPPAEHMSNNDYAANFEAFLEAVPEGAPFAFWYGGIEPHRRYEYGAGLRVGGKALQDVERVYPYWPDTDTVRTDLLDYAFEVEYFDRHLGRMLDLLEARGQLENTLVVVTSDNGMPFPRIKGQAYELSNHMPLAVMWPAGIRQPGRAIADYVSFIDFAPTFLEVAGLDSAQSRMQPMTGRSLTDVFGSDQEGQVDPARDHVLIGKERHDIGRPGDGGYPIRGIVKGDLLYLRNFEPERWPAGNPETGYLNTDGSPTKTQILNGRTDPLGWPYWAWSFGKRPAEELYDVARDPACAVNLAALPQYAERKAALEAQLLAELEAEGDPRVAGEGDVFDAYPYAEEERRGFYERYMRGEAMEAGWVNETDFEEGPLDEEPLEEEPNEQP